MDDKELAARARALGLTRLAEEHPEQLRGALKRASDLAGLLPQDLHWTEECAHVFRLPEARSKGGAS